MVHASLGASSTTSVFSTCRRCFGDAPRCIDLSPSVFYLIKKKTFYLLVPSKKLVHLVCNLLVT